MATFKRTVLYCLNLSIVLTFLVGIAAVTLGVVAIFRPTFKFTISTDAPRQWGLIISILLGALTIYAASLMFHSLRLRYRQTTLKASLRMIGWLPVAGSAGIIALSILIGSQIGVSRIVETVLPLAVGVHAALVFAQDDDPTLEAALTFPRPLIWTVLERLALVFALQLSVGLLGTALTYAKTGAGLDTLPTFLAGWIVPSIFFAGLGIFMTLVSRQSIMGVCMAVILWFGTRFVFDLGMFTFPFLWPAHVFLQPHTFGDFWINRAFIALAGLGMLYLGARQLEVEERVLLGGRLLKPKQDKA